MKAQKYYTLVGTFQKNPWEIIFGDYDREVVEDERADIKDCGTDYTKFKIITTSDKQGEIEWAVSVLNAKQYLGNTTNALTSP